MPGSSQARLKTHRFFGPFDLGRPVFVIDDREIGHQISSVLRLEPGETIVLLDGSGQEAVAEIGRIDASGVEVRIVEKRRCPAEPARRVTLYAAVLKRENFEFIAQKATETGVTAIVPVLSGRTVKLGIKKERLAKIVREAAEQSGRGIVPAVTDPMRFKEALSDAGRHHTNVFFEIDAPIFAAASMPKDASVGVFIGPEGGWTEEELAEAAAARCLVAGLGPLTLRAETAATIAVFLACNGLTL